MKKLLLLPALLAGVCAFAQSAIITPIAPAQYDQLKAAGQLDPNVHYVFVSQNHQAPASPSRYSGPAQTLSNACNCMLPLDTTFQVVPFLYSTAPDYRNDDDSSPSIALPFSFNFYGTTYNSVYINNNGNISFLAPYPTFTAMPFPDSTYNMIAPFWADVDTRDAGSGLVYYKITPTALIVKWDSVGYYAVHSNLISTFQLIITDGTDPMLPAGTNVAFCYGDMQWTTGDASAGSNGFGGFPSTTGVNEGNGTDYFQVTQNDAPGMAFDGPYGATDGVDWLDDLEIYFNTAITGNTPPLVLNSTICDTIDVYTGDTLRTMNMDSIAFDFVFMTPEVDQTVTATFSCSAPASAFSYTLIENTATYKKYSCVFRAVNLPPGVYTVTGTGTDNGAPAATTSSTVFIHTHFDNTLGVPETPATGIKIYPNPTSGITAVSTAGASKVLVTDMLGQVVYTAATSSDLTTVDMTAFAPGVYVVSVLNNDGSVSKARIVRQ